jgi:hypothetical protein
MLLQLFAFGEALSGGYLPFGPVPIKAIRVAQGMKAVCMTLSVRSIRTILLGILSYTYCVNSRVFGSFRSKLRLLVWWLESWASVVSWRTTNILLRTEYGVDSCTSRRQCARKATGEFLVDQRPVMIESATERPPRARFCRRVPKN